MLDSRLQPVPSTPIRKLGNWIHEFQKYMGGRGSPEAFTKWSAIFAVASALERRTWIKTRKGVLYPNLYCILVGPPGAGKTQASSLIYDLIHSIEDLHTAPSSVTKASLIDALEHARRDIIRPGQNPALVTFNALTVISNELGTFIPAYDSEFMNVLTDLYDNKTYSETRRTAKINIKIDYPWLNILAPTTPSYLNQFLPEGAWDQGFLSRCLLVYSGTEAAGELFGEDELYSEETEKNLRHDLYQITRMFGKFTFEEDVAEALTAWHKSGGQPAPDHPKLTHYNTRRTAHLLKLCMIASAADNDSLIITLDHYVEAMDWLVLMEEAIPDIFKSMKSGGDGKTIEETYHFLYQIWMKKKEPVSEFRLYHFLQERTPAHNVERIAEVMVKAGLIEKKFGNDGVGYVPRTKRPDV